MSGMNVVFDFGETKHVKLLIHSIKNESFEIASASYKLIRRGAVNSENEGAAVIYEHTIDIVISPQQKGRYNLEITYHIADETLIENVGVLVL